jgi:dihydroorotase (multifunctional complex type)
MAKIDLRVRDASIVTPEGFMEGDLYIQEGKVIGLGQLDLPSSQTLDADGLLLLPGMVDAHVHFMDPADLSREDFPSGSSAAAVAGVTTVIEHSHGSPVHSPEDLRRKADYLKNRSVVDFALGAHFSMESPREMDEVFREGAAFIKVFTCTTHGIQGVPAGPLYRAMNLGGERGPIYLVHAEDESLTATAEKELKSSGRRDGKVIPEWRSRLAEEVAVEMVCRLADQSKAPVVIAHCSHAPIVDIVADYRQRGARIWAEGCPQYFFLKEDEIREKMGFRKFTPPARALSSKDQEEMWKRLRDGKISYLASDHAPATRSQKSEGSIWDVHFGLPGVDTTLPVMLDSVSKGLLSYPRLVDLYARMPARIYGLYPRKGALQPGSDGDFILVDPKVQYPIEDRNILSKAGWTPYAGRTVQGKVVATYLRGQKIAEAGRSLVSPGWGKFIRGKGWRKESS